MSGKARRTATIKASSITRITAPMIFVSVSIMCLSIVIVDSMLFCRNVPSSFVFGIVALKFLGRLDALDALDVAWTHLAGTHNVKELIITGRRRDDRSRQIRRAWLAQELALCVRHPRGRGCRECECLFHVVILFVLPVRIEAYPALPVLRRRASIKRMDQSSQAIRYASSLFALGSTACFRVCPCYLLSTML